MVEEQQTGSTPFFKRPLVVGISAAVVAVLVGGGAVYVYENNQNTTSQNNLQAQINSLKTQLATATSPTPTASPMTSDSPTATSTTTPSPVATATPTPASTSTADIQSAQKVINTFLTYMTNAGSSSASTTDLTTDRSGVLNLFTPASTSAEKSDFAFLAGTDITAATSSGQYPDARILGGTNGFGYTVTNFTIGTGTESSGTVTFPVTETRNTWNGSVYVNSTVTDYVDMVQVSGNWMVENYYTKGFVATSSSVDTSGQQSLSLKYSAF
jgi:hypothetical protein